MRTLEQFLSDYGDSHRNPTNQLIHYICVPIIVVVTLGMLWMIPLGQWLALSADVAPWVNGATVFAAFSFIVYLRLGLGVVALMMFWFALSLACILGMQEAGLHVGWTSLVIWVLAWIGQFYGHKIEGKKPSFADDLIFLLIGPIFVSVEIGAKMGLGVAKRYALH